ncbi:hypothetical protein Ancab_006769 [Ancistrocladus abbreviatus]
MRPSLLISLLAFHLLLSSVQGIRTMKSSINHEIIQGNNVVETNINGGSEGVVISREGHCSSGKNRKIVISITTSTFATKTTSENLANGATQVGRAQENVSVGPSPTPPNIGRKFEAGKYEDMMDMTEMDYSAAKRKPPIHN